MTKKIVLIQHGEPKGDRGLTPNGAKAMNALAERLHGEGIVPQLFLRGPSWPEIESAQSLTRTFDRLGVSVKAKEAGNLFESLKGAKQSARVVAVLVCAGVFAELAAQAKSDLPEGTTVAVAELGDDAWAEMFHRPRFSQPFKAF